VYARVYVYKEAPRTFKSLKSREWRERALSAHRHSFLTGMAQYIHLYFVTDFQSNAKRSYCIEMINDKCLFTFFVFKVKCTYF